MIEMMAREISLAIWDMDYKPRDPLYAPDLRYHLAIKTARAALSVLAANVSDEMVEAYTRSYYNGDEFLVREIMRNERDVQANKVAIAAALSAAALPPLASGGDKP